MKEDGRGDATASQHHPVAVSQCLLMIYSCRVDGERKENEEGRGTPTAIPSHLASCGLQCFNLHSNQLIISFSKCYAEKNRVTLYNNDIGHKQQVVFVNYDLGFISHTVSL